MNSNNMIQATNQAAAQQFPVEQVFMNDCLSSGYIYYTTAEWLHFDAKFSPEIQEKFDVMMMCDFADAGTKCCFVKLKENKEANIYLYVGENSLVARVFSKDQKLSNEVLEKLKKMWPKSEVDEKEDIIEVAFWMNTDSGAKSGQRFLDVVKFKDVQENYEQETRDILETLMDFKPTRSGQIFLFSGTPGTGKTYAIRALMNSWKLWADIHYVMDPVTFFEKPEYITKVLFQASDAQPKTKIKETSPSSGVFANIGTSVVKGWKVVLLEDVGEILQKDAKHKIGQGWPILTNITDGLIGQSMRVLFVMTTNEKLTDLHEAINRPGRCAVSHEFKKFSANEASKWLVKRGHKDKISQQDYSLAEMYNEMEKFQISVKKKKDSKIGFR